MATRTPKQIAAAQRRSLKAMRAKLLDMAAEWSEVDEYNRHLMEAFADEFRALDETLADQANY